jgi:hypothetical protein
VNPERPIDRDKRRWKRYSLNTSIRVLTDTAVINGRGIRMSEGGICLFAVVDLPVGSLIKVEFTNPGSRHPVRVHGAVRNRAVYLYGVEFLAGEFKEQLRRALVPPPQS